MAEGNGNRGMRDNFQSANVFYRQPVIAAGISSATIITAIDVILDLGIAFGWWEITEEQFDVVLQAVGILVPLSMMLIATWWGQLHTTPYVNPSLPDGTPAKIVPDPTRGQDE